MKAIFLTANIILMSVMFAGNVYSHGSPHVGNHPDAYGIDCLEPIYAELGSIGYWENSCSTGVNVHYRLEDSWACETTTYAKFPCAQYVAANSRATAFIVGRIQYMACEAATRTSGPFPVYVAETGGYQCKHLGYAGRDSNGKRYEHANKWILQEYSNGRYFGQFDNGNRSGIGMYLWDSGERYLGEWLNGDRTGHGTYNWTSGNAYSGQFRDGEALGETVTQVMERLVWEARQEAEEDYWGEEDYSSNRSQENWLNTFNDLVNQGAIDAYRSWEQQQNNSYSGNSQSYCVHTATRTCATQ